MLLALTKSLTLEAWTLTTLIARAAQWNLDVDALPTMTIHGNLSAMTRKADASLFPVTRRRQSARAILNTSK